MTALQWFLILIGPFLTVAPFVLIAVRECPELLTGRPARTRRTRTAWASNWQAVPACA
jgi:hypothetical protein